MMNLLLAIVVFLFYIALAVLAVALLLWGLRYLGVPIPPIVEKVLWFLVALAAIYWILTIIIPTLRLPSLPRTGEILQPLLGVLT